MPSTESTPRTASPSVGPLRSAPRPFRLAPRPRPSCTCSPCLRCKLGFRVLRSDLLRSTRAQALRLRRGLFWPGPAPSTPKTTRLDRARDPSGAWRVRGSTCWSRGQAMRRRGRGVSSAMPRHRACSAIEFSSGHRGAPHSTGVDCLSRTSLRRYRVGALGSRACSDHRVLVRGSCGPRATNIGCLSDNPSA